ncbi:MAG TPA: hypothetical protein VGI84_12210 [Pseudonocardiaceae bacterium]
MSQDAEQGASADVLRKELADARERMEALRAEATDDVNRNWGANHKPQELIDLKVNGRLAANGEYQSLRSRVRELEGQLPD